MSGRIDWQVVDGVLLLDKPAGLSSNAALQRARRLFAAEKGGHTGNLDPIATGLLPLCFGEATKFSQYLLDADKIYCAEFLLGVTTTTGDSEGEVLETRPVDVSREAVERVLAGLTGAMDQVPPMHSALKHQGRKLYEYARAGIEVARAPRRITVHALDLDGFDGQRLRVRVHCSKGTYVRVLGEAIGERLGCGAHMTALRRTAAGGFELSAAHTLDALEIMPPAARGAALLPVDTLAASLMPVQLDAAPAARVLQGQRLRLDPPCVAGLVRLYAAGQFIGVGDIDASGCLSPRRLLRAPAGAHCSPGTG